MTTERGFVDVNGARLFYESRGEGRTLLFLHGFTFDHRMWRRQLEGLSQRYRVIAYDARGFGKSSLPEGEYRHHDDAAALCEALDTGPVVAIGHSIGAHQLLELALAHPQHVAGFAAICMAGLPEVPFPAEVADRFAAIREAANGPGGIAAAKKLWRASPWLTSAKGGAAIAAEVDAMLADYSGWHWTHDNPTKSLSPSARSRLGELRVPALVLTGANDLEYNTAIARILVDELPNAEGVELARAGHLAPLEEAEAVNRAIDSVAMPAFDATLQP